MAETLVCALTDFMRRGLWGGLTGGATEMSKDIAKPTLTKRQMALVEAYVANGGNLSKAAEEAGYAPGNSGRVTAWKTMKLPYVQQMLMQKTAEAFGMHAVKALGKIASLSDGAKSEYVQLEASKDILDRAGFKPIERHQMQVAGDIRVQIDLG
jgi:hypothetical protein